MDDKADDQVMHKLETCMQAIRQRTDFIPHVALVLGSGLGDFADHIEIKTAVSYQEIPGFPVSTVAGHRGRYVFGYLQQVPVVLMQGRVHYYEGYPMTDVVLPVRLMGLLGAKKLILTNAAGGVNPDFRPGDFMLITDHISTAVPSPLIGQNPEALGPRFPDMSMVYSRRMCRIVRQEAERLGIALREGVYVQFTGPAYETPAEIRMCRMWGGDAVGMSTACEAVAARHMGMEICGISCITNMAAGLSAAPLNHREVEENAGRVSAQFCDLISAIVPRL
ncbi:MAG: purine-nucleoside phosphorylase [Bilifractor sp.]